jgi:hypothetical protein
MGQSKTSRYSHEGQAEPDFVSRWSRLKHEVKQASQETGERQAISGDAASEPDKTDKTGNSQVLTDADMPDIDSLTFDSVFSDFMSPGVSEKLRKNALRKLFCSDVFNIRDGLDDYDGDYTQFEKLGDIVTSDMYHQMEMEARRRAEQLLQHEEKQADDASLEDIENARQESVEYQGDSITTPAGNDGNEAPFRADASDMAVEDDGDERKDSVHGGSRGDE